LGAAAPSLLLLDVLSGYKDVKEGDTDTGGLSNPLEDLQSTPLAKSRQVSIN